MYTIRDVAKLANVSATTVSRVLNDNGYVSDKTKEKVQKAIEELDFTPNYFARGLVHKKTKTIGLLVPNINNPFFPEIAKAIEETIFDSGYSVILSHTDNEKDKEEKYIRLLLDKSVDGVIITGEIHNSNINILIENKIPIIVTDARITNNEVPSVYTDNVAGGNIATSHLIQQGYKRIGHIKGPKGISSSEDRYIGYKLALEKENIDFDSSIVKRGDYQTKSGYIAMKQLLQVKNPPDAVFVANDLMSLGAIEAIRQKGLRIPSDIALVGFDGIPLIEFLHPKLTTIQQPFKEIGVAVAQKIIHAIEGKDDERKNEVLKPLLKIGQTTIKENNIE